MVSGTGRGIRSCMITAWRQASSRAQRPIGMIKPVSSASEMKFSGAIVSASRMHPAQQRLHAMGAPLAEANHGLVVDFELIQLERLLQLGLQLQTLDDTFVHRSLEDSIAALAVTLSPCTCDVRVPQELLGIWRADVAVCEADAQAARG